MGSYAQDGITESNCHNYGWLKDATVAQLEACAAQYPSSAKRTAASTETPEVKVAGQQQPAPTAGTSSGNNVCRKNISFAVAWADSVNPVVPGFAGKWALKNGKKYPGVCFSQTPVSGAANYLLVFANSSDSFRGIYPTVRTSTSTSVTPVSGTGTVTDNYGGMWSYNYNGTVTTTTTTTQQVDAPYIDTAQTLYLSCYRGDGTSCGMGWRSITTRTGGDPYNTLGYNLGSMLASIHMKQNLLRDAVNRVAGEP